MESFKNHLRRFTFETAGIEIKTMILPYSVSNANLAY